MSDLRNSHPVVRISGPEDAPNPKYLRHAGRIISRALRTWAKDRGLPEHNDVAERGFGRMDLHRQHTTD